MTDASPEQLCVSVLRRRAALCRRLSDGAVPISVMHQLAAFASDYESETIRLQCQREETTPFAANTQQGEASHDCGSASFD
jgi:hypothetical protein